METVARVQYMDEVFFLLALMPLGKAWILLLSIQILVNSKAD